MSLWAAFRTQTVTSKVVKKRLQKHGDGTDVGNVLKDETLCVQSKLVRGERKCIKT